MFRATIVAAMAWCVFVLCLCMICVADHNGALTAGMTAGLGPEQVTAVLVTAIASVCTLVGAIVNAALQTRQAAVTRQINKTARKIDDAVNNRHHLDEAGKPAGIFDVVIQSAEDTREALRLAVENRELILSVQDEQSHVRKELEASKDKGCLFHSENQQVIDAIKKQLNE